MKLPAWIIVASCLLLLVGTALNYSVLRRHDAACSRLLEEIRSLEEHGAEVAARCDSMEDEFTRLRAELLRIESSMTARLASMEADRSGMPEGADFAEEPGPPAEVDPRNTAVPFDRSLLPPDVLGYEELVEWKPKLTILHRDLLFRYASNGEPVILQFHGENRTPVPKSPELARWALSTLDHQFEKVEMILRAAEAGASRGEYIVLREGDKVPSHHKAVITGIGRVAVPFVNIGDVSRQYMADHQVDLDQLEELGISMGVRATFFTGGY